jgi:16S rRNA processing protein RimM
MAASNSKDTVVLGRVSRPNGLSGAVVVQIDPSMSDVFVRGLEVELAPRSGSPRRTRVRSAAPVRGGIRATFEGVEDRNASEALVGADVLVEREALRFDDGEFLESDMLELDVVDARGTALGRIVEVIATGANDVYVARATDGSEVLIPAVGHAVLAIDLEARRMTVDRSALEFGAPPPAGKEHAASDAPGTKSKAPPAGKRQ